MQLYQKREGEIVNTFFNFHDCDIPLSPIQCSDNVAYCDNRENEKLEWTPFLSFPVTKKCNFRCIYCGIGGEATGSQNEIISLPQIQQIAQIAIQKGIRKFRLTGGEPLLHPDIGAILSYFSELGMYTLINTNGSYILKRKSILDTVQPNIRFAVSLDTLIPEKLLAISSQHCLQEILCGIEYLKDRGLLLRCNMVVGKHNIDEVPDIIRFCQKMNCDLKILDIVSVPVPYGVRGDFYQEVNSLEKMLMETCNEVYSHEYSRGFGTPCFSYRFEKTFVTVKNSKKGSHYDCGSGGICDGCQYFPCHEGLYDIFALSDNRLCACRWTEKQSFDNMEDQMQFLIDAFRRSRYVPVIENKDMGVRSELVK